MVAITSVGVQDHAGDRHDARAGQDGLLGAGGGLGPPARPADDLLPQVLGGRPGRPRLGRRPDPRDHRRRRRRGDARLASRRSSTSSRWWATTSSWRRWRSGSTLVYVGVTTAANYLQLTLPARRAEAARQDHGPGAAAHLRRRQAARLRRREPRLPRLGDGVLGTAEGELQGRPGAQPDAGVQRRLSGLLVDDHLPHHGLAQGLGGGVGHAVRDVHRRLPGLLRRLRHVPGRDAGARRRLAVDAQGRADLGAAAADPRGDAGGRRHQGLSGAS